jgi:hypothetical protein
MRGSAIYRTKAQTECTNSGPDLSLDLSLPLSDDLFDRSVYLQDCQNFVLYSRGVANSLL